MTEEFLKKLNEANDVAIAKYNHEDEEFKNKCKKNREYIEMYLGLVLSLIKVYDYRTGKFDTKSLDKSVSKVIGTPDRIHAYINEEEKKAKAYFHYGRETSNMNDLVGAPDFINKHEIDFKVVNEVLKENGVSVREDLWDGGERGSDEYILEFDATLLLQTRASLLAETESAKKKIFE